MITPWFKVEQNHQYIIIVIKAKHVKISADSEPEIHIGDCDFKFYCRPYYLRLHFTNRLIEDGRECAEYEKGFFRIKVPKLNEGEHFDDLNMLTKLLTLPGKSSAKAPSIQLIGESDSTNVDDKISNDIKDDDEEEEGIDWHIEQTLANDEEDDDDNIGGDDDDAMKKLSLSCPKYGFANMRQGVFKTLQEHLWNVIDLKNADGVSENERKKERIKDENDNFDDDHYLADLYQLDMIGHLINFKPEWMNNNNSNKNNATTTNDNNNSNSKVNNNNKYESNEFTREDEEDLLKLPRKRYILDKQQKTMAYLGLLDILFAYAYDHRTTESENNVESGWTISKLSSTLSWLDSFVDMRSVVLACVRRSLAYPLYRNFRLSLLVWKDVVCILRRGREYVLKCLLQTRRLLLDEDDHYLLNQLYVDDYCCWLQSTKQKVLACMVEELDAIKVRKEDVEFDLVELEHASMLVLCEVKRKEVCVLEGGHDSDDDDDDEECDSDEVDDSDDEEEEDDDSSDDDDGKKKNTVESAGIIQPNDEEVVKTNIDKCIHEIADLNL